MCVSEPGPWVPGWVDTYRNFVIPVLSVNAVHNLKQLR